MPAAINPGGTDLDAELNSSAELVLWEVYRDCRREIPIIASAKNRPMPIYYVSLGFGHENTKALTYDDSVARSLR
jgi:hypothetical protein